MPITATFYVESEDRKLKPEFTGKYQHWKVVLEELRLKKKSFVINTETHDWLKR